MTVVCFPHDGRSVILSISDLMPKYSERLIQHTIRNLKLVSYVLLREYENIYSTGKTS